MLATPPYNISFSLSMSYTHIHKRMYHLGLFTKNLVETIVKYIVHTYVETITKHLHTCTHTLAWIENSVLRMEKE